MDTPSLDFKSRWSRAASATEADGIASGPVSLTSFPKTGRANSRSAVPSRTEP